MNILGGFLHIGRTGVRVLNTLHPCSVGSMLQHTKARVDKCVMMELPISTAYACPSWSMTYVVDNEIDDQTSYEGR